MHDYYQTLGVSKTATQDEIKKAYRKLAHQHHPDKAGGDEAKFKEISQAYSVLGNEEKKKQYDQLGHAVFSQSGGNSANGFNWNDFTRQYGSGHFQDFTVNFDDIGDVFGDFFGFGRGGRGGARTSKGSDMRMMLDLHFMEAVFGVDKTVVVERHESCSRCHGTSLEPGTELRTCYRCAGNGKITANQQTFLGTFQTIQSCPDCRGNGRVAEHPCSVCKGRGIEKKRAEIKVSIPAGIDDGETVRLSGQGEAGEQGADHGDLYITVRVKKHTLFVREGTTIRSEVVARFTTAVLGGKIDIPTLDGTAVLKIPAGTPSGKVFRLKEKGVPDVHGRGRGDHLVTFHVEVPTKISKKARKLLDDLKAEGV
ncbi:MAG: Chaperone protein DnaJ [Parcubacteria group bacterium GW2011_GWA2_43_13]|nr:MAG: Chaperone protein DnaJ [Parcubacteria group bacterium GW2011_GWA2_43_13]OGY69532.1 MAG: molecular chaperone DnaJ [Candidatus Jacksonbacteria bacterium RIFCSPHIGHO2_02_FULL_43_10]OGY70248.1 MAG: molecular chaperone DnaJ [Candidatus Jacksonbacteria bacterium RIFCSPLOWO2_01_FULL_44_13]HAZ16983.1 molecular chaperone DnaJ [Candidatus Jacksonbacteria bacterium]